MKRLIFLLSFVLCIASGLYAQTYKYYSTEFAYKVLNDYGNWTDWSDWEPSHCLITLNLDRGIINIYSKEPQEYDIYDANEDIIEDVSGGKYLTLKCVDRDGLRCEIRLRMQSNQQAQLYVDYNNIMFVYNIIPKD